MSCMVWLKAHIGSYREAQRRTEGSYLDSFLFRSFISVCNPRDTVDLASDMKMKKLQRSCLMTLCSMLSSLPILLAGSPMT